jgi:hypothetical protein
MFSLNPCLADIVPKPFVVTSAPTDCDPYQHQWSALKEVALVESPATHRIVGKLSPQETAKALTGEIHVTPLTMNVTKDHTVEAVDHLGSQHDLEFHRGDHFYLMGSSSDELGSWKILVKGTTYEADIDPSKLRGCKGPSENCWASQYESGENEVWWVKFQTKEGVVGWADVADDKFRIPDTCDQ